MVSSAGGLKQISGATMSTAGMSNMVTTPSGVKMIVVSSSQLAQTTSKPITISMPSSQKTVTLSASGKGGGQIVQTASGQILQLPAGGLMSGGKPVTVQMAGGGQKTLTLVQAPQSAQAEAKIQGTADESGMITLSQDALEAVTDETAQAADSIKIEEHPPQVDGGVTTPPNEIIEGDISEFGVFFSQVDGAADDPEAEQTGESSGDQEQAMETTDEATNEASEATAEASGDAEDTSDAVFVKEELPEVMKAAAEAAEGTAETEGAKKDAEKKDSEVVETKRAPAKDPLAEAMSEVTGGLDDDDDNVGDKEMDSAAALAALASAAVAGEDEETDKNNDKENAAKGENEMNLEFWLVTIIPLKIRSFHTFLMSEFFVRLLFTYFVEKAR